MADEPLGGRYRRVRELGRGAMGEVWLADDTLLHRQVAIKSLRVTGGIPDPDDLERMLREARLAARLNHPSAVALYDLIVESGRPNLVMEYIDGPTLAEQLRTSGGRLPPERVAAIGAVTADALAEAHRLGIVHRDVKPGNIMINDRGVPKLGDFGIARIGDELGMTASGMLVGTPMYTAPEVARGADAGPASDVWSLGMTLFVAIDGGSPFQRGPGDNALTVLSRVAHEPVPPVRRAGPFTDTIMRMVAADPRVRPSATEAATALRAGGVSAASTGILPRATAVPPGPPPGPVAAPLRYPADRPMPPATPVFGPPSGPHPLPPSGPPPRDRHTGRTVALVAAACVVLAVLVTGAVLLARRGSGSSDAHTDGPRRSTSRSSSRSASSPSSPTRSSSSSSSSSNGSPTPSTIPTDASATYSAPGGVSVRGPNAWTEDDSAGIANIRDYLAPGDTDRSTGTYFRVGIGNPHPKPTIQQEATEEVKFLSSGKGGYSEQVVSQHYLTFLGVPAVEFDLSGDNKDGVARHELLRLWIMNGVTYEIELNAPESKWAATKPLFSTLTSTCQVS